MTDSACPCSALYVSRHSLNWTRCETGSQWRRSRNRCLMWSCLLAPPRHIRRNQVHTIFQKPLWSWIKTGLYTLSLADAVHTSLMTCNVGGLLPRKNIRNFGEKSAKNPGRAHTPEVWNLSRVPRRASFGNGSATATLPPRARRYLGAKFSILQIFALNSPKMGGRVENGWHPKKILVVAYNRSEFRGDAPKKGTPKVVFNIGPHTLRPEK